MTPKHHQRNVIPLVLLITVLLSCSSESGSNASTANMQSTTDTPDSVTPTQSALNLGDRPAMLVSLLETSPLKDQLAQCDLSGLASSALSFGHRGAPFQIAEHTRKGYIAAANQGAGVIECDVTFTKDKELVCRHSQCDLHTTTNILATELAQKCSVPPDANSPAPYADVQCCTSDITLAEFRTLKGKRDGGDKSAASIDAYLQGTPGWTGDANADYGELLSHKDSIELFDSLGVAMAPELKAAQVEMPFDGDYTQANYAAQMLNDYVNAGIEPGRVFAQSFNLQDLRFWQQDFPDFAQQAALLDGRYRDSSFDVNDVNSWNPSMDELVGEGIQFLAPPLWMLLALDSQGEIVPSDYAIAAKTAGLELITWTVERSGPITSGNNWYYQSIQPAISNEGDVFKVIDVLARQVSVAGIFSDWPATTTFYSHCTQ